MGIELTLPFGSIYDIGVSSLHIRDIGEKTSELVFIDTNILLSATDTSRPPESFNRTEFPL